MADSCVIDRFVEDDDKGRGLMRAIDDGRLELVTTHVQGTENERTPDPLKRARLAAVPRVEVGASVCVLGHWRLGVDRLGNGEVYKHIARSPKDVEDGMIADTAVAEGLPLVTEDARLRKRALEVGAVVWRVDDLIAQLRQGE
jgi:hypothetical protein